MQTTTTHESKHFPGVTFTLHRIGPRKRAQMELALAEERSRQRRLSVEYFSATKELENRVSGAERDSDGQLISIPQDMIDLALRRNDLESQLSLLSSGVIRPALIAAGLISITGGEYDGLTCEDLCEYGPADLFNEIAEAIEDSAGLNQEQVKNSKPDTTSTAVASDPAKTGVAEAVRPVATGSSEIVDSLNFASTTSGENTLTSAA